MKVEFLARSPAARQVQRLMQQSDQFGRHTKASPPLDFFDHSAYGAVVLSSIDAYDVVFYC